MWSRTEFSMPFAPFVFVQGDYLRSVRLIEVSGDTKRGITIPGTCCAEPQIHNSARLLQTSWASRNVELPPLPKWSKSLCWGNEKYIISSACLLYMYVVCVVFLTDLVLAEIIRELVVLCSSNGHNFARNDKNNLLNILLLAFGTVIYLKTCVRESIAMEKGPCFNRNPYMVPQVWNDISLNMRNSFALICCAFW